MEIKINDRYTLTGSPAEMAILMILMDTPEIEEQAPDKAEQTKPDPEQVVQKTEQINLEPEQAPAPTPKKPRKAPTPDWVKARALRNAGWTLKEIARELHVSPQTVANHLGGGNDDE